MYTTVNQSRMSDLQSCRIQLYILCRQMYTVFDERKS